MQCREGNVQHRLNIRMQVRAFAERVLGAHITSASSHGHRLCSDIRRSGTPITTVFDIGAHIGTTTEQYRQAFPDASIHCFEPGSAAYAALTRNVGKLPGVICNQVALGSAPGEGMLYITGPSNTNSLIGSPEDSDHEEVKLITVDAYCLEHNITGIDLMKTDTEGYELEVLHGAYTMLSSGRVKYIVVEAGFHPGDSRHILFDEIRSFLLPMGYFVYGIYHQHLEWTGEQRLRFADVCFVNQKTPVQC